MDFSKIKDLVKQNGDKFIVLENGEPELVVLSFSEYEWLTKDAPILRSSSLGAGHYKENQDLPDLATGFRETEFMTPATAELASVPRNVRSYHVPSDAPELFEADARGLPLRLEDIRLEDLPI